MIFWHGFGFVYPVESRLKRVREAKFHRVNLRGSAVKNKKAGAEACHTGDVRYRVVRRLDDEPHISSSLQVFCDSKISLTRGST